MREKKENEPICIGCGSDERKYKAPAGALEPNSILHGRYLVGAVCSQGPSGFCYAALDLITERRVDMCEWKDMGSGTAEDFVREEGFQAKKNGLPGIAQVYDTFTEQGRLFAAVEHLPDEVLRDHLAFTSGAFTWNEAVRLLTPVMESVRYLNAQGCVYGDISPETVRIRRENNRKLSARLVPFIGFDDRAPASSKAAKRPQDDVSGIAVCLTKSVMGLGFTKDPSKKSARKSSGLTQGQGEILQKGLISGSGDGYASMGDFLEDIQRHTEGSEYSGILGGRRQKKSHKGLVVFLIFLIAAGGSGAWAWQNGYLEKPIEIVKGYANYGIAWLNGLRSERVPVPSETEDTEPGSESAGSGMIGRIPDFAANDDNEDEDLTESWTGSGFEEETEGMTGESTGMLAADAFEEESLSEADAQNALDALSAEEAVTENETDDQDLIQDEADADVQNLTAADASEPAQEQGADEENADGQTQAAEDAQNADGQTQAAEGTQNADGQTQTAEDAQNPDGRTEAAEAALNPDGRTEADADQTQAAEDADLAAAAGSIDRAQQYKDLPWVKNVPEFNELARNEILGTTAREPYSAEEQKAVFRHRHAAVASVSGMSTYAACDEASGEYHLFAVYEQHIHGISQALPVCEDLASYSMDEFSALASEGEQTAYDQVQEAFDSSAAQAENALASSDALRAYADYLNGSEPASFATPNVNSLNVRNAPKTGEVLGQINLQERTPLITPVEDGWVMIDFRGQPAYVAGSYVTIE